MSPYSSIFPSSSSVSKAEAVRLIAARCGVSPCEAAAVGDACNDIPMLQATGFGIAMENATDEVKKAAAGKISFSKMTLPHTLFRLVCCEQIYRAFTIIGGATYHK